jgi:hypothetical protein
MLTLTGHTAPLLAAAFSPDGKRIVTASLDGTAKVWDAANGKQLLSLAGHLGMVWSAGFSPNGRRILTGGSDGTARLWDAANGRELLTLKGHSAEIRAAFSPDGRRIGTASYDQTAKVWEAASSAQVENWRQEEEAAAAEVAAEERRIVADQARDKAARAQDPGAIKQWLVLLPIPYDAQNGVDPGPNGARALREEQVENESQLRPRAGKSIKAGGIERTWREARLENYEVNFDDLAGMVNEWSVAYAVAYIYSETTQRQLKLNVGSADQSKIYLNGKPVYQKLYVWGYVRDRDEVETGIELQAGLNVLVFKVVKERASWWKGSVRFTDAAGQPLKGIRVSLDPDGH